jgi:putative hydrolase of the HAD superfamily
MDKIQKDKLIVFDMDGTLYKLKGGTFLDSKLNKKILENVIKFIQLKLKKDEKEAREILNGIKEEYGENISIALEEKFGLDRYDYFNCVWNIESRKYIIKYSNLEDTLVRLTKEYKFILMSDAPKIWIEKVLKELNIERFFNGNILSGEGGKRKIFGNYFSNLLKEYNLKPEKVVVVGDQENTDIIPAKKLGINTIYINKNTKSEFADVNLVDINNLEKEIINLFKK